MLLVNSWHWFGFPTLVFLAAIHRIPKDFIEAARLDGASEWRIAREIIWPLMAPAVTIIVVLTFIGSFNWFEIPYIMNGLEGSALAVLMFIFIFIVSIIATKYLTSREVEMS